MALFFHMLKQKWFLYSLLLINSLGTIYGYFWYKPQLQETPVIFLPFVPDSPTASLFFVFVLIGFLMGKNFSFFEALASITLFKYGIWAVGMNMAGIVLTETITIENGLLILSHFGMAIQSLLYAPYYRIKRSHFLFAVIWTLHNDFIDYVYDMFPVYPALSDYIPQVAYITFWLSIFTIFIVYHFSVKQERFTLRISK